MVKVAIAGGFSGIAQEIVDVLVANKTHEVLILTRKNVPAGEIIDGVTWVKTDYEDPDQLVQILQGVQVLLSFIIEQTDAESPIQKRLIDAAVEAGVKRFAPSEWASSSLDHLSWYEYKGTIRKYLSDLNKDKKILEYSLFQPGIFTNYLSHPHISSKHFNTMEIPFDFDKCRALVLDGGNNDRITFTTVQDLANTVANAIDFEDEWPVVGGIRGSIISVGQLIAMGEKIRGKQFKVEKLKREELEAGTWKSSWVPKLSHPSIPLEQVDVFSRIIVPGILLATSAGAYDISDEWNGLLPDYKFTQIEQFLSEAWRDKP